MIASKPQRRKYSIHSSGDGEALRSAMAACYPDHTLELESNDFQAQISFCPLNKIWLYYGRYKSGFRLQVHNSRQITQGFPIRGSAECGSNGTAMPSTPHKGSLSEPGEVSLSTAPNFEHFAVVMDPEA